MKITNRAGLPDAIVRAVEQDPYEKGEGVDYSVTELLKPPRAVAIAKAHWDDVEEDVLDRIWALFGSALHVVLERSEQRGVAEQRLKWTFSKGDWSEGRVVSGRFDRADAADEGEWLEDYKTTSVWTRVYGSSNDDWESQLNMLAYLAKKNGYTHIKKLGIVALFRDWQRRDLDKDTKGNYPKVPIERIEFPLWKESETKKFIEQRIRLHEAAKVLVAAGEEPPECSDKELWLNKKTGIGNRCERYCQAAPWCRQYQRMAREGGHDL